MIGPDSAATLNERDRIRVRGGVTFPGSGSVTARYDRSLNQTLDTRSDREVLEKVWPDLTGTVRNVPLPPSLRSAILRLSVGSGYTRRTRGLEFGARTLQDRFREDHAVPFSTALTLAGGLILDYRGRAGWGEQP